MQGVQVLAFIFVHALDLDVEDGIRIEHDVVRLLDIFGQTDFVVALDLAKLLQYGGVVLEFQEFLQLCGVVDIAVADFFRQQGSQLRVGLVQPAAVCNAVGHVLELLRHLGVEIVEDGFLEDVAVQRGYTVDGVGADDRQIRHLDVAVVQRGHTAHLVAVHMALVHGFAEAAVDLLHDLIDARQAEFEELFVPAFERFRHNGVVGVRGRPGDDVPGRFPGIAAFVQHHAHHLGDGEHRMRVVQMDGYAIRQVVERAVLKQVAADNVLDRCGHQEILLRQAQALALQVIVLRIEHLCDDLRHGVLLHCAQVVAAVEAGHVEGFAARGPDAQHVDAPAVHAGYIHVVRHRHHFFVVLMVYNMVLIVPVFFDVAAKVDLYALLRHLLQPNFSTRQPEVRQLRLPAVDQFLAEDAIFIAERIPHRGIPLCGQAIQETRRQTAKAAVAQARIRLFLIQIVELEAHFGKRLAEIFFNPKVVQVVLQGASHQEFHAEVIDALGVRLFGTLLKFEVPFYHEVAHDKNNSLITLIVGCVFQRQAKVMLQLCFNLFFDRIDRQPVVHKKSSKCPRSIYM